MNKKSGNMVRFIISLLVVLVIIASLPGCYSSRMSAIDLKGLMLLDKTQLGRNRTYYSRHDAKKIVNKHQKFHRKIKKKAFGNRP